MGFNYMQTTQLDMQNMHISISYMRDTYLPIGKFVFVLSKDKQSFLYGSADYNLNCYRKITVKPHGPLSPIQASELNLGFAHQIAACISFTLLGCFVTSDT